ncbi:MAG: PadR family transcriptional regulator [Anaerolineae bacterium]|jgi:transcriptional regulator|nr:PadR family transcriptional regulator [Anaerolineae bacterium]
MNMKGSLPLLILHVLAQGANHGYRIAGHIKEQSSGVLDFKEGTLYPTLHALEQQGLIESFKEMENGRERRYYRLTQRGAAALAAERGEWEQFAGAVNAVLKGAQNA